VAIQIIRFDLWLKSNHPAGARLSPGWAERVIFINIAIITLALNGIKKDRTGR
jgi:hypothetical protein